MTARRRSVDSSSSSSSDSLNSHNKSIRKEGKKEKREERKKDREDRREERKREKEEKKHHKSGHTDAPFPHLSHGGDASHFQMTQGVQSHSGDGSYHQEYRGGGYGVPHPEQPSPPPYVPQNAVPPPSGYRIPLTTQTIFPLEASRTGPPAFIDADGVSPIFIGSALMERSVHPCKIGPHLNPYASVPYGGGEHQHQGRFDLLPFLPEQMEWVRTSGGRTPSGKRPIDGGYEEDGRKLYHAVAVVNGIKVPGKTGEHLVGARVPFGGIEHEIYDDYEILCWRH